MPSRTPPNQLQTVQVNGISLTYLDTGGPRPVVLLLHGAFMSHRAWQSQIQEFDTHYRVIAPDLRAHGRSERAGRPYSAQQFAGDIQVLLDVLEVSEAHVCGHSLGGMVALELALIDPRRVRTLVLAETSYGTRSTWLEAFMTDCTRLLFRLASIRWQARLFASSLARRTPRLFEFLEAEVLAYVNDRAAFLGIWDAVIAFDVRARLSEVVAPTLVVLGERNRQTHAQGRTFAARIPHAQLKVVPDGGHLLTMEQPAAFNALLREFWSGYAAEVARPGER